MTIIYNCNKNSKKSPVILSSGKRYISPKKRKLRCFINEAGEYAGFIKIIVFLLIPFLAMGCFWLLLFGRSISLNYKIYNLKNEISQTEEQLNFLAEKSLNLASSQKIEEWAKANNFIEVKNISYLDLTNENVARR